MTTIHAYTGDQNTQDAPHRKGDKRRARRTENIIPNSTGLLKQSVKLFQKSTVNDGGAQRVPVATGSLTELTVVLDKQDVTADQVNEAMKQASDESFGYTEDEIVSSDVVGMTYGSLFDATQTRVMTVGDRQLVKVATWYDNEMSYTSQLVRTLAHLAELSK